MFSQPSVAIISMVRWGFIRSSLIRFPTHKFAIEIMGLNCWTWNLLISGCKLVLKCKSRWKFILDPGIATLVHQYSSELQESLNPRGNAVRKGDRKVQIVWKKSRKGKSSQPEKSRKLLQKVTMLIELECFPNWAQKADCL
jgi:hypothetical protein